MKSWPKIKLGQIGQVGSNIDQNHICVNSYVKLIKSEIRSSWSRFEHCSESLV